MGLSDITFRAATRVGVTPFTISEWRQALEKAGFEVKDCHFYIFRLPFICLDNEKNNQIS